MPDLMFFFNDTATTEIYTLSLHDALPIYGQARAPRGLRAAGRPPRVPRHAPRSEEHTSELQSRQYLVCRLLLEKKIRHPVKTVQSGAVSADPGAPARARSALRAIYPKGCP